MERRTIEDLLLIGEVVLELPAERSRARRISTWLACCGDLALPIVIRPLADARRCCALVSCATGRSPTATSPWR